MNTSKVNLSQLWRGLGRVLSQYRRREDGVSAAIISLSMVGILGAAAMGLDVGHVYEVQRWLQASADSAALAGANYIDDGVAGDAVTHATTFGVSSSGLNANSQVPSGSITTNASLKCFSSLNVACVGANSSGDINANGIQVVMSASVPMYFAKVLGIQTMTVKAVSTAQIGGFKGRPYNIMFIIDNTGSMGNADSSCGKTRIQCVQAGMQLFLSKLDPTTDTVGLMVFPEINQPSYAVDETSCNGVTEPGARPYVPLSTTEGGSVNVTTVSNPYASPAANYTTATYPTYWVGQWDNSYSTGFNGTLNASDGIVIASGGSGISNCPGLTAPGGANTFYADVITSAQYELTQLKANGTTTQQNAQNVIIFLGDGDANSLSPKMYTSGQGDKYECYRAYQAAQAAATAGTWVFSFAYGAPTGTAPSGSCETDTSSERINSTAVSACVTLQNIASNPSYFYSDDANGCVSSAHTNLTTIAGMFTNAAQKLQQPRLIPNNTT